MKQRTYTRITIKQERFVIENYLDYASNRELGSKVGLTAQQVRHIYRKHGLRKIEGKGHFKKRHKPWNKGKRGDTRLGGTTKFKAGHPPINTVPVGTIRTNKDGLFEIKYELHKWRSLHAHKWIEANGPIPKGRLVVFRPNADRQHFTVADLELITRAENLRRNNPKTSTYAALHLSARTKASA